MFGIYSMQFTTLVLLSLAFTLCPMISRSAEARRQFVPVDFIPNERSLVVSEQSASITVTVPVPSDDVTKLGLQVWLLKADGTVVPQQDANRETAIIGMMGSDSRFVIFTFAKVPLGKITGIVFRKAGKLYSRQLAAADWRL
jgi:hypothetical protein